MTNRVWTNTPATPLSAAMLNGMEADIQAALEVPDTALAARLEATGTAGRTALDAAIAAGVAGKEDSLGAGSAAQFLRGDKVWAVPPGGGGSAIATFADLQAAVTAGGTVNVGDAAITMTGTINVTVPVKIIGGHYTVPEGAAYPAFTVTSSDVTFDRCRFTGATTAAAYAIDARFIYAYGTLAAYLSNVNVIDCKMTGSQTENIRFVCVREFTIRGNLMDDFLYAGFLGLSVENGTVSENIITDAVMKSPVVNVYGIALSDSVNTVAARSRNVRVIGNYVENVPWEGIDTHGGDAIIIQGNHVISCVRGIALVVGNETRLTVPVNCVVSGNYVDKGTSAGTEREGISLFGLSGNLGHATITGNIVKGYSTANAMYLSQYIDPLKTLVEGNSHPMVPWTNLTMDNPAQWTADATFIPQYMVDGRTVFLRGFVKAVTSSTANSKISTLPAVARPTRLTFAGASHGSNTAAGTGTLGAYDNGDLFMLYRTGADLYSYPIECSFQRNYTG